MRLDYDVVICGAGLAGLTLARQLRLQVPDATIALVDRMSRPLPEACHKVGESTVELATHYLATVLELEDYLRETHILKNGLRFFPGGGATLALEARTEMGPPELPIVPSFQLDRGTLENDLRAMNEADGVTMFEGWKVTSISLNAEDAPHEVALSPTHGGDARTLSARWVIDASGRRQFLSRQLGLRRASDHDARAAWFRVKGRVDVAELVPESDRAWHERDRPHIRWQSTVHFMGEGYWVWLIPLSSGHTSVGVVVDAGLHPFETIHTESRVREWLAKFEPVVGARLADVRAEDFRCYREYSYGADKVFSSERWATVGEAGTFLDPFYSPGSDFIALANCFVTRAIDEDLRTGSAAVADLYDGWFLRCFDEALHTFRGMLPCFGNPRVMTAKIYWDNLQYWSFLCQYFMQRGYEMPIALQAQILDEGSLFSTSHRRAQALFRTWHRLTREDALPEPRHVWLPPIPSLLASTYLDLQRRVSADEMLPMLRAKRAVIEEMLAELVLHVLRDLPVEAGRELAAQLDLARWELSIDPRRLSLDDAPARERRRALPPVAKDLERCLGKPSPREDVASWEALYRERLGLPARATSVAV